MMKDGKSPELVRVSFEPQPISIEQARFVDLLDPEHEDNWEEFREVVERSQIYVWGFGSKNPEDKAALLFEIYDDDDAPQVFRDRAMAWALNDSEVRGGDIFKEHTEGSPERVNSYVGWLKDLISYQTESENRIVESNEHIRWDIIRENEIVKHGLVMREVESLFANSLIGREEFEDFLNILDLQRAERHIESGFLVVSSILEKFSNRTEEATPLQHWSFDQFNNWMDAQLNGEQTDTPPWLDTDKGRQLAGVKLSYQLCRELHSANQDDVELFFDWVDLLPAIEYSGALLFREGAKYDRKKELSGWWQTNFGLSHLKDISKQPGGRQVIMPLLRSFLEARQTVVVEANKLLDWEIVNMEIRSDPRTSLLERGINEELFLSSREVDSLAELAGETEDAAIRQCIEAEERLLLKLQKWDEEISLYIEEDRESRKSREKAIRVERQREREAAEEDDRERLSSAVSSLKDI